MIQIIRYSVYRTSSGDGEGHREVDANCLVLQTILVLRGRDTVKLIQIVRY